MRHLEEAQPDHVVRIHPENLSLPYITNLGVMKFLDALQVHLDPFFIALWKHALLVEIIRHRYHVDSATAKQNFLNNLREKVARDDAKRKALDYLEEFQDRFWCETDERVREIVEKFESRVAVEAKGQFSLPGIANVAAQANQSTADTTEERLEEVERFQRIVNEAQVPRLNKMIEVLNDEILDKQHFTYIVIDDLDVDWVDERVANSLIRCLFRAVQDLKRVRNLKVLVALRTNIFQELQFGERFGQEEKLRALVIEMRWTRHDLEVMLDERTRAALERAGSSDSARFRNLLPATNKTRGDALKYMLDRTLLRPRDLISFANECLDLATGETGISWSVINQAERAYSEKRLLALRDEWKPTYPDIHLVFEMFRGAPAKMTRNQFAQRLEDLALLLVDPGKFRGSSWLTPLAEPLWSSSAMDSDWVRTYQPLTRFLFSLGFVGCVTKHTNVITYAYDDPTFVDRFDHLGPEARFAIHPAFQAALEVCAEPSSEPKAE